MASATVLEKSSNPLNSSIEHSLRKKLVDPPTSSIDLSAKNKNDGKKEDYVKRLLKGNSLFMKHNSSFN